MDELPIRLYRRFGVFDVLDVLDVLGPNTLSSSSDVL
jgi:hypothetical protein